MRFNRPRPWRPRAPFSGRVPGVRRRGQCGAGTGIGTPLAEGDTEREWTAPEADLLPPAFGTPLAFEQPDVVRIAPGRIDESGLLAFHRRTTIAEHANLDGRLPANATGRRSA